MGLDVDRCDSDSRDERELNRAVGRTTFIPAREGGVFEA